MSHKLSNDKTIRYIPQRDPENRKTNDVNDIELTKSRRICSFDFTQIGFRIFSVTCKNPFLYYVTIDAT